MTERQPRPALIVGLGNPGKEYAAHRHNVGAMVVQRLASTHALRLVRRQHCARVAQGTIVARPVVLALPLTYMNRSGESVRPLTRRYQVAPADTLLVYDDLDLPLGRLRLRPAGSSGGHKGVASVIQHLGTDQLPRLRIGIDRPPGRMDPADYVLTPFRRAEQPVVDEVLAQAVAAIECWLREGIVAAMNAFNPAPPGVCPRDPPPAPEES